MADDSFVPLGTTGRSSAFTGGTNAPPGYGIRRAMTVDDSATLRRRPAISPAASREPMARRRSSTFSDSLLDAGQELNGDILNPAGPPHTAEKSPYVYVPLVVALMPALGGVLFENGSSFFTDIILLGVSAVFLHWSVTQPWRLYHAAREIRVAKDDFMMEPVFESDEEDLEAYSVASATTALENVPEEDEKGVQNDSQSGNQTSKDRGTEPPPQSPKSKSSAQLRWDERREAAVKELYRYEVLALAWCFVFPIVGAGLLHTIRGQLSRPSEGLISNFNLTIFLLAAEYRPVSHVLKLVQERTLHYQNIVATNPYAEKSARDDTIEELKGRLVDLETRAATGTLGHSNGHTEPSAAPKPVDEAAVARDVREGMQPELEALKRAVRRYEKKLAVMASQIDNRLEYVDARLNDAIALAAVAVKHSNSQGNLIFWLLDRAAALVMIPVNTTVALCMLPFRTAQSLLGPKGRPAPDRYYRAGRAARPGSAKANQDRMSPRMPRKPA